MNKNLLNKEELLLYLAERNQTNKIKKILKPIMLNIFSNKFIKKKLR